MAKNLSDILTKDNRVSFLAMLNGNFCENVSDDTISVVLKHDRTVVLYVNKVEVFRTKHRNIEPARRHYDALRITFNLV